MAPALLRLAPVHASPPLSVGALALAPVALACAVVAALTGRRRPARRWRPLALALLGALGALGLLVAARGPTGLRAVVSRGGAELELAAGPIDLIGDDLDELPGGRRTHARWSGRLRVPRGGLLGLWASGRGRVTIRLDGREVVSGEGERLEAGASVAVGLGEHFLAVDYERVGPGPRLRVGWERSSGREAI